MSSRLILTPSASRSFSRPLLRFWEVSTIRYIQMTADVFDVTSMPIENVASTIRLMNEFFPYPPGWTNDIGVWS